MNKKALYESIMKQISKEVKKALNEADEKIIYVAEVYYNDDDGYDRHVIIRVRPNDTEDTITDMISDEWGYIDIDVVDITTRVVPANFSDKIYDVIEVLD